MRVQLLYTRCELLPRLLFHALVFLLYLLSSFFYSAYLVHFILLVLTTSSFNCVDMSHRSSRIPFLKKGGDASGSKPPAFGPTARVRTDKPKDKPKAPEVQVIEERHQDTPRDDSSRKKARTTEPTATMPAPRPPSNATHVHHLFAKLGYAHATETEATNWCGGELEETADSVTKCLAEAFVRQASHLRELKSALAANSSLEMQVKVLKFKLEEDHKSLVETHKLETAQLKADLHKALTMNKALDHSLKEAEKRAEEMKEKHEAELAKLRSDLEAAKIDRENAAEEGQVEFMKGFIQKIPDFDWDRLGPGNAEFAESLRKELEDEAKEAAELEAKQAEEAKIAEESSKAHETANANETAS